MPIIRNPQKAAGATYDLIIIGGGIYGAMLAYSASCRGLKALLLEQGDFGGATSFNSLKTIHGGLRYLQDFNLSLFRQFVNERRWFIENFPTLVQPLPVLMPLYGEGLRRPAIFRAALLLDRMLSRDRNQGLPPDRQIPFGRMIDAAELAARFPLVRLEGLRGGAIWHDACMPDTPRLIMAVLRAACAGGATALNYLRVEHLRQSQGRVCGVVARDLLEGASRIFRAETVINCGGPWVRRNVAGFGCDLPMLYRPSLAWNILFDYPALSTHAVAVSPPAAGSRLYFLHPWKGRLLAGTGHAPRRENDLNPRPTEGELARFLIDLNLALPEIKLEAHHIRHVYAGFLPAEKPGSTRLLREDLILDHAAHGGPAGLFSLTGTKFTASHRSAEKLLDLAFPAQPAAVNNFQPGAIESGDLAAAGIFDYDWQPPNGSLEWAAPLRKIIESEAVAHLDDLILRRTSLGDNPARALELAPALSRLFDWDETRRREEIERVKAHYQWK